MAIHHAQHWQFTDPVYQQKFELSRGAYTAFVARTKKRFDIELGESEPGAKCVHIDRSGRSRILLWFPTNNRGRSIADVGVVAHEATHGCLFTLMRRGLDATIDNHEAYCYYLEWLLAECLQRLRGER